VTSEAYSDILKTASDALSLVTTDVRISGDGPGRFLFASLGDFGIEFYAVKDGFVVDPAIQAELQGERMFDTADAALRWAADWLTHKR
jgi:hypothetical protein